MITGSFASEALARSRLFNLVPSAPGNGCAYAPWNGHASVLKAP
jgi:hypothetical protein